MNKFELAEIDWAENISAWSQFTDFMGEHIVVRFKNGYGVSVVRGPYTYGGTKGLWELAVLAYVGEGVMNYVLDSSTPIGENTFGNLAVEQVVELARRVSLLEKEGK